MEKKSLVADPWGFCGTHEQKQQLSKKNLKQNMSRVIFSIFLIYTEKYICTV